MEKTKKCEKVVKTLDRFQWLALLLARFSVGAVFLETGWGKLHHLPKVIDFFASLGIPLPGLQAPFIAMIEFLGGLSLILGVATRFWSFLLTCTMFVAIITAKHDEIHGLTDLFGLSEYLYGVILVVLVFTGAGALSLDRWICKTRLPGR
jgi:putative oxidoreductase